MMKMHRSKKYVKATVDKSIVNVDYLDNGQMFIIGDEEFTPIEITKLALFYSLNLDEQQCIDILENI